MLPSEEYLLVLPVPQVVCSACMFTCLRVRVYVVLDYVVDVWWLLLCDHAARAYLKGNLVATNLAITQQTTHTTKQHDSEYDRTPTEQHLAEHITTQATTT